jgi:plastocyanin
LVARLRHNAVYVVLVVAVGAGAYAVTRIGGEGTKENAFTLADAIDARPLPHERVLTLYSPRLHSEPYVHNQQAVFLRPNGREAPKTPGYITAFKEQVLVDSKRPDAKPLPIEKMMVHHLLYFAPNRVDQLPGSCWGLIGLRAEEHPLGSFVRPMPRALRSRYGINNRQSNGRAPNWLLVAMVMNHYKRPKSFYVRTKVYYTTKQRQSTSLVIPGNCSTNVAGMLYDIPGSGGEGSDIVDRGLWTVPRGLSGRIVLAQSHQHGGAKYQTLGSRTCGRELFKAPAYYGPANHPYNTIRPILHEPGPIGSGTFATGQGVPIREGEVLERAAVHDNAKPHVAAMGFWMMMVAPDPNVRRCGPLPGDVRELNKPPNYNEHPNYDRVVPQLWKPSGPLARFKGKPLAVGDDIFRPGRISARVGETVSWRFNGSRPHSVSVANGPRGFSSIYWGQKRGTYSFTPSVRGTYRLTCLVHPTRMGQTLVVR